MNAHCYIVCYDLCQPGRDYSQLYKSLKEYPYWGKITESVWAIVSPDDAVQILKNLRKYIDTNDRIMVLLSGKSAAWIHALADDEWLKTNLIK